MVMRAAAAAEEESEASYSGYTAHLESSKEKG
jgi:hypothetical protein